MTDGVSAFNTLPLEVDYSDNNAIYKCVATSVVLPQPMSTQIQLTVNCKHYINSNDDVDDDFYYYYLYTVLFPEQPIAF